MKTKIGKSEKRDSRIITLDGDLTLFRTTAEDLSDFREPYKTKKTLVVICQNGNTKGRVNFNEYEVSAPFMFVILKGQIIQLDEISTDFSCLFISMSSEFTEELNMIESIPLFLSVKDNPLILLTDPELRSLVNYHEMSWRLILNEENPYRKDAAMHLTKAFFYGIGHDIHRTAKKESKSNPELYMEKFLGLVKTNFKQGREVKYYAEKLFITPKYLSKIVKKHSGKSAKEWIDEYIILEAKSQLKFTSKTTQQISEDLNFPSQSFFGKYFKRITGMTPTSYRN